MLTWFRTPHEYLEAVRALEPMRRAVEQHLSGLETVLGYCDFSQSMEVMKVGVGAFLGDKPNLREGMVCEHGLSNRKRLVLSWIRSVAEVRHLTRVLALERISPFFTALSQILPEAVGSEYLGEGFRPGEISRVGDVEVRHEDVTALSFEDGSFEIVTHSDVLEHVFHHTRALNECRRVLQSGGELIFTCPFFDRPTHLERACISEGGKITHLLEPAYHGNPLSAQGSLVFRDYGWPLLEDIREAGFREAWIGLNYDPVQGFVSNNDPYPDSLMMPLLFRAVK